MYVLFDWSDKFCLVVCFTCLFVKRPGDSIMCPYDSIIVLRQKAKIITSLTYTGTDFIDDKWLLIFISVTGSRSHTLTNMAVSTA